jgi:hypothetical protein
MCHFLAAGVLINQEKSEMSILKRTHIFSLVEKDASMIAWQFYILLIGRQSLMIPWCLCSSIISVNSDLLKVPELEVSNQSRTPLHKIKRLNRG